MHRKLTNKTSFAITESKCTRNWQIKLQAPSSGWCLMNELSFIRNSAASFYYQSEQQLLKLSCRVSYKRKFIHQTPARRERLQFYLPVLSALRSSDGEACFICRFSVRFSDSIIFSQKLLFWSFFNFYILFLKYFVRAGVSVRLAL